MAFLGPYGVFVVRVWLEPEDGGEGPWRASVLDTVTRERHYFTDPAALTAFLGPEPPGGAVWRGLEKTP